MPNLVHSLDASNIHILCEKLNNQPLYIIHDCCLLSIHVLLESVDQGLDGSKFAADARTREVLSSSSQSPLT